MKKISLIGMLVFIPILYGCNNGKDNIRIIHTDNAPEPIGPYSQAVIYNNILYCSGQIGIDPKTNNLVDGGTINEAKQALNNLKAIIEAANTTMNNILKANIYLININDFNDINEIYESYFTGDNFPSRVVCAVKELPKYASVEIEAVVAL